MNPSEGRICNLCGADADAGDVDPRRPADVCPECRLRSRHRAYGALCALIGDPTAAGAAMVCHADEAERRVLFPAALDLINFDVRPAKFLNKIMDIQDMREIGDATQDVFVALHVLQHVRDDRRALDEVARVLKPGAGQLIVTVPFRRGANTEPYPDVTSPYGVEALNKYGVGTFRRYGLGDFRALMEERFAVCEYTFIDPLLKERSTIFHARKLNL